MTSAAPSRWWPRYDGVVMMAAAMVIALTFSNFWVMLITGPADPTHTGDLPAEAMEKLRYAFFPAYLLILLMVARDLRASLSAAFCAPFLLAITGFCFVSALWSIDPEVTFRRAVGLALTNLAAVGFVASLSWRRLLQSLAIVFAFLIVFCYVVCLFVPAYGRMQVEFPGAWQGAWSNKNMLGMQMAAGFVVLCCAALADRAHRRLWLGFAGAALGLVIMSTSKTALVSVLLAAVAMGLVILIRRGPVTALIGAYLGAVGVVGLGFCIAFIPDLALGLIGKDATLTGRTLIWSSVVGQIAHRPWLGFGFGAVWDNKDIWSPLATISKQQGFTVHEAHNAWLQITLDLGFVGIGIWSLAYLCLWLQIALRPYRNGNLLALPFLLLFSLTSITEASFLSQNNWLWMLFVIVAVKAGLNSDETSLKQVWMRGAVARAA